jgi:hypothetical protein
MQKLLEYIGSLSIANAGAVLGTPVPLELTTFPNLTPELARFETQLVTRAGVIKPCQIEKCAKVQMTDGDRVLSALVQGFSDVDGFLESRAAAGHGHRHDHWQRT